MVRTHICAHQQQMNVVNHIICVDIDVGSPFEWVYSLNYPTIAIVFCPVGERHRSLGNFQWLGECDQR
jgi:hypothetical protein